MRMLCLCLALFLLMPIAYAQLDTHPPAHPEYAAQMALPFFIFALGFREIEPRHGGFVGYRANGQSVEIRRVAGAFDMEGGRYYPFVSMSGEFMWMGPSGTIRKTETSRYTFLGGRYVKLI